VGPIFEEMMDEISWAYYRITWTLFRDAAGLWVAFSSTGESHNTTDKTNMESWLMNRGLQTEHVERLIRDLENNGEGAITVSRLHEPPV
jgi:hypothetical protein